MSLTRPLALAAGALLLGACSSAAGTATGRPSPAAPTTTAASSPAPASPSIAPSAAPTDGVAVAGDTVPATGLSDLFAARTAAVVQHDEQAFLATVDPANAALVAQQKVEFANLTTLPLSSYAQTVDKATPPAPGGSGTWLAGGGQYRATVQWKVDAAATVAHWGFSASVRAGHLVITADEDADPYALTPLVARSAPAGIVMLDQRDRSDLGRVVRDLSAAITADGPYWDASWLHRFVVFGTSSNDLFDRRWLGGEKYGDFAAYVMQAPLPQVAGQQGPRPTEPRMVLDLARISDTNADTVTVLRHELTHAASSGIAKPATATWVTEGYADLAAFGDRSVSNSPAGNAAYDLQTGTIGTLALPPGRDDGGVHSFYGGNEDAIAANYNAALLAMTYIKQHYGTKKALAFFEAAQGQASHMDAAFGVLGTTTAGFVSAWNAWARTVSL